jgi:hypothetical protein
LDAKVVYHNGFAQDGMGKYERGAFPWLDLLVRLGETWYGPEREPDDGIVAQPLPDEYRWEGDGGFGVLPNGEAWWTESATEGVARLIGPSGELVLELPLRIEFSEPGEGGEEVACPPPNPTVVPP